MLTASLIFKILPYIAVSIFGLALFVTYKVQAAKIKRLEAELKKVATIKSQSKSILGMQTNLNIAKELLERKKAIDIINKEDTRRDIEIINRAKRFNNDEEIWKNIDNYFGSIIGK